MTPEKLQRLQACLEEAASILYEETSASELQDLESIEKAVRAHLPFEGRPSSCPFFIRQATGTDKGRERQVKSCVGVLPIREKQASQLGLKPRTQISPLLEKCCLLVSANESYKDAESDDCCADRRESGS